MAQAAQTQAKPSNLLPFRRGTRKRVVTVGQFAITPGSPLPTITLPQVGFLSRIYLVIEGTITLSAAGTQNALGYSSLISRVRVNANLGSTSIVDVSGIGLEMINQSHAPNALPVLNTFGNAAAANFVRYGLMIPINANDRKQMEFGLIGLQAPQIRVTLDVIFNALTAFTTNSTASSLTAFVAYEYWEYPNPTRYALPARTLVRTIEDAPLTITATGDQIYTIPRLGTMAELHHLVLINGARAVLQATAIATPPQVNEIRMRINKTDTPLDYQMRFKEVEEALLYNRAQSAANTETFLRQGVVSWDFWHASEQNHGGGDGRDFYNTEEVTTLESILTIDPTVAIAGLCQIQPVRRVFQRLA